MGLTKKLILPMAVAWLLPSGVSAGQDVSIRTAEEFELRLLYEPYGKSMDAVKDYRAEVFADGVPLEPQEISDEEWYVCYRYMVPGQSRITLNYRDKVIYDCSEDDSYVHIGETLPLNGGSYDLGEMACDRTVSLSFYDYTRTTEKLRLYDMPRQLDGAFDVTYQPTRDGKDLVLTVPTDGMVSFEYDPVSWDMELTAINFQRGHCVTETVGDKARYTLPKAVMSVGGYGSGERELMVNVKSAYHGRVTVECDPPEMLHGVMCAKGKYVPYSTYQTVSASDMYDWTDADWSVPQPAPTFGDTDDRMMVVSLDTSEFYVAEAVIDGESLGRNQIVTSRVNSTTGSFVVPMPGGRFDVDHKLVFRGVRRRTPVVRAHLPEFYVLGDVSYEKSVVTWPYAGEGTVKWSTFTDSQRDFDPGTQTQTVSFGVDMGMDLRIFPTGWGTLNHGASGTPLDYLRIGRIVSESGREVTPAEDSAIVLQKLTEDYDIYFEAKEVSEEYMGNKKVHINLPEGMSPEDAGLDVFLTISTSDDDVRLCDAVCLEDNTYGFDHPLIKFHGGELKLMACFDPMTVMPTDNFASEVTNGYTNCVSQCMLWQIGVDTPDHTESCGLSAVDSCPITLGVEYDKDVPDYVVNALGERMQVRYIKDRESLICHDFGVPVPKYICNPDDDSEPYEVKSVMLYRKKMVSRWIPETDSYEMVEQEQMQSAETVVHSSQEMLGCLEGEHYLVSSGFFIEDIDSDVLRPYDCKVIVSARILDVVNVRDAIGGGITVGCHDGAIVVTGAPEGTPVRVHDITGMTLYAGTDHTVEGLTRGMYIVEVASQRFKIRL